MAQACSVPEAIALNAPTGTAVLAMLPPQHANWPLDFNPQLNWSPALIANQLPNANGDLHASALILIALVLFSITLFLNALARLLVWRVSRGPAGAIH